MIQPPPRLSQIATVCLRTIIWMVPVQSWALTPAPRPPTSAAQLPAFLEAHCADCHDSSSKKGGLNMEALSSDLSVPANFDLWLKIRDAAASGEMPPPKKPRPDSGALSRWLNEIDPSLLAEEKKRLAQGGRATLRRMTAAEYENALRDLLNLPQLQIQDLLPPDGYRQGFSKVSGGLEISHVHLERYQNAARAALEQAIATQPKPPKPVAQRIYPAKRLKGWLANGAGLLLENKQLSQAFPLPNPPGPDATRQITRDLESKGIFDLPHAVAMLCTQKGFGGMRPNLNFGAVHPGEYRIRLSIWGLWWNAGKVESAGRSEALVLDKSRNGLGFGSEAIGYFDAPSLQSKEHEVKTYLQNGDIIYFEGATLPGLGDFRLSKGVAKHTGPGVAIDWVDIEGPLHSQWPPDSHRKLFGDLPIVPFDGHGGVIPPEHSVHRQIHLKQQLWPSQNSLPAEEREPVLHTVHSDHPMDDARRLLGGFLPRAFRRPVDAPELERYLGLVAEQIQGKECFEAAMTHAYLAALTSTDFLLIQKPSPSLSETDFASRLSFWLWNSPPDPTLLQLAGEGKLREKTTLHAQIERMLADTRSNRFLEDFLNQWLNLRAINDTVPDPTLYPEFDRYLRDSMPLESHAFLRELISRNLPAHYSVSSPFLMLNQRLAEHYGIPGVIGAEFRRVPLPKGTLRGGFLGQASVLKVTANGTTTSPVVRGAFVTERLLGKPIPPPPPNIPAIEPDTRGASTIREILEKHRVEGCASCHRKMDPPGFALESFDVIGGARERYRSLEKGTVASVLLPNARRIKMKSALPVDSGAETAEGETFRNVEELRGILLAHPERLARAWVTQLITYATGAPVRFADRAEVDRIVQATASSNYGVKSLILAIADSPIFQQK